MPVAQGKTAPLAFISGGSSGIGLAIAHVLARKGYRIALAARDMERVAAAASRLRSETGAEILESPLDVADETAVQAAIAALEHSHGPIDWLIPSAGIVEPGLFADVDLESHHRQWRVNYFGTLALVHAALPGMHKAGGGRITLIASAAAFTGIAGYSGYGPGKAALKSLGESLSVELAGANIQVNVAFPPDTDTPQYHAEQAAKPETTKAITAGGGVMQAEKVAEAIVAGAEAGRFMITPGWLMTLFGLFHSLHAPLFRWQQRRILARLGRKA